MLLSLRIASRSVYHDDTIIAYMYNVIARGALGKDFLCVWSHHFAAILESVSLSNCLVLTLSRPLLWFQVHQIVDQRKPKQVSLSVLTMCHMISMAAGLLTLTAVKTVQPMKAGRQHCDSIGRLHIICTIY